MPFEENCAMDQRLRFVGIALAADCSMTELCETFSISRKTGYKWLDRYREFGAEGLVERSHAPLRPAHATAQALADEIVEQRLRRPNWGPRKIIGKLADIRPDVAWPSPSTAGEILRRAGLVGARRLRRRAPPRLGAGARGGPLTITDSFSRYLIGLGATANTREEEAKPLFERAFHEHGLPD